MVIINVSGDRAIYPLFCNHQEIASKYLETINILVH